MNSIIEKKCKVVMLPTKIAENCLILEQGVGNKILKYYNKYFTQEYLRNIYAKSYHLYIISDDEVKIRDWTIDLDCKESHKRLTSIDNQIELDSYVNGTNYYNIKKIIATTNTSLNYIKHDDTVPYPKGEQIFLPKPSPQFITKFIEEYNKGFPISEILVEYEEY